jgi:hypothetical protein
MKLHALWILLLIGAVALSGCAASKPGKTEGTEKKDKPEPPKLVGRIASVPADKRFVLIQSYGKWNVEAGSILTTRGADDRTANLLVTGESLGHFAAADVQSGSLEVGDAVYSRHVPKPPEPAPGEEPTIQVPENQQIPLPENVQKNN